MNKLIIPIIALAPFQLFSNQLIATKWDMIYKADYHLKLAQNELRQADEKLYYIPDFEKRQHLHTLIHSSIASALIPDPKAKILAVSISMIGNFIVDAFDDVCEFRDHLIQATHHFEMANLYNHVSTYANSVKNTENSTVLFLSCIDKLTKAELISLCISDPGMNEVISTQISGLRNSMIKKFITSNQNITLDIYDEIFAMAEDISEITADVPYMDFLLAMDINMNIANAAEDLAYALRAWFGEFIELEEIFW